MRRILLRSLLLEQWKAATVTCRASLHHQEEVNASGERVRPFGQSKAKDDAFGHGDAFAAIRQSIDESKKNAPPPPAEEQEEGIDEVRSSQNRRRNRRKKNMDTVLGDVLNDALRLRDMGKKPDMDFIYKQTQERVYEAEHGRKPPSATDRNAKYVPFPPDQNLNRLAPAITFDDDPWPERSITASNPVLTTHQVEEDRRLNAGKRLEAQEAMYAVREGRSAMDEFSDSVDELTHWEFRFLEFVRDVPVGQRRTLPLLHEHYRMLVHRLIRAEKRFLNTRDAAMRLAQVSADVYKRTEDRIERLRSFYSETHKSLSSPNYDPIKMKKSVIGGVMKLSAREFEEWKRTEEIKKNELIAEFSKDE